MRARFLRLLSGASLLAALALGGCKTDGSSVSPDDAAAETETGSEAEVEAPEGEPIVFASVGVPHGAAISLIALDPEGKAALTRDTNGSVRLWPALDGSREPLIVPIRDPRTMALASDGAGGWTLALLDATGGARLVAVDPAGKMQPLASLPPTDPLADIVILPGSEQVVAVGSDHVIRLLDRQGNERARLDTPKLRPASLRVAIAAEGGPRVVAVTAGEFDGNQGRFAVELITVELGADSLALARQRQTIHLDSPPVFDNPTISPDGRSAVYLQRQRLGGATWKVIATSLDDGRSASVDSEIGVGQQPRVGLLPEGRVLLDDGTGLGRIVDLRERHVELAPLRASPTINHLASSFAAGVRAAPASNWLAVHDLASDDLVYLGYDQVNVMDAGLSPTGASVAWAFGDRVAIERIGDEAGEVVEVPGTRAEAQRFVDFLDEDLLLTLDWSGGAKLIRWRDGEVVSALDIGNHTQTADFARDGQGNGVLFVRTNLWQNPTVVELRDHAFAGHYVTQASAHLAGLLAVGEAGFDGWGAWTLDGGGKLRTFTLAQLREGIPTEAALADGKTLSYGVPEQLAIDHRDRQYWIRTTTRPTLHVVDGDTTRETELAPGFVVMLVPSRDGRRIAVIQQRDLNQLVTILDSQTLQPLWARPIPATNGLAWSDGGEHLAVPATISGGVVFDADDGEPLTSRCGLAFEVRRTPPVVQGFFNGLSVCDL